MGFKIYVLGKKGIIMRIQRLNTPTDTGVKTSQNNSGNVQFKGFSIGITKHELNINTITDFLVIAFASWGVGHGESTFTRLATFLRQGGAIGISKWLDWMPSRSRFEIFTLQAP